MVVTLGSVASRDEILSFCDDLLDVRSFEDYGPNGLQVPGTGEVSKVATGVSANLELLRAAVDSGAELVLTHHGLLWGSELEALSVPMAARLRALLCAEVSLAAYHLPLDAHPEIGNNALLRDALGLEPDGRPFGEAKGAAVGAIGRAAGADRRGRAGPSADARPSAGSPSSSMRDRSGSRASASSPAAAPSRSTRRGGWGSRHWSPASRASP